MNVGADAITGDPGPLQLVAHVWHDDVGQWQHVGDVDTSLASGDPIDLALPAGSAPGDLVVVEVTDSATTPRTTAVRVGYLPRPVVTFSSATATVDESAGTVTLTLQLSFAPITEASVHVATANGTAVEGSDYQPLATTVTFAAGETSKTVDIAIIDDVDPEPAETFTVTLSSPQACVLGTPKTVTVTIPANDSPIPDVHMAEASVTREEYVGTVALSVVLSTVSTSQVTVNWSTAYGTALAGQDYVAASGTVVFDPGQTSKSVFVTLVNDSEGEPDEAFSVVLSSPSGAVLGTPNSTVVTILDDDNPPTIDPTAFTLSFVDCAFRLDGNADAVTPRQGDAGAYVHVTVDNPEPAADWSTAVVWVDEATEFSFDLGLAVEPGAAIAVTAEDEGEDLSSTALVAHALSVPPTFTAEHTTRIWRDETDSAVVTVDPIDITDISGPVTLRLSNLTAGTSSTLAMACPASSPASISIAAAPSDEVAIEACTGSQVLVCSDPPIDLGMAGVQPLDLDGATVTGMWRAGPTVLVGTDTGIARVISLDDPWHPVVLPWQVPLPNNAPAGVIGRGPSSVAYADGSHLLLWDATAGIVSDFEPLGAGMPIDLVLVRGTNAIVAGHDASGVVVATTAFDVGPSGTLCASGSALALSSTANLTPLALLPLSSGRVGVLTDDIGQPVRIFDVDGPSEPEPSIRLLFQDLPAPAQAAWLDDDWLTAYGADNQLYQYRMPQPGTGVAWSGERTLARAYWSDPIPQTQVPLCARPLRFRSANFWLFGREGHRVRWLSEDRLPIGQGPVVALAETHRTLLAATSSGVYQVLWNRLERGDELRSTAVRWEGDTLHIGAEAIGFGGEPYFDFWGSGTDANGDPANVDYTVPVTTPWLPMDIALPDTVGEATDISWSHGCSSMGSAPTTGSARTTLGPRSTARPSPIPSASSSCPHAAPTSWRPAPDGARGRQAEPTRCSTAGPTAPSGSWARSTPPTSSTSRAIDSNHLVIAGDVLTFVDLTDLASPATTTLDVFSGPEGNLLNVGSDLLVAAPATLEMAVVDVSDPSNPALATGRPRFSTVQAPS